MAGTYGYGQRSNAAGVAMIPPPLAVRADLRDEDVDWLNSQLELIDRPAVRYARKIPLPPIVVFYSA